MICPRCRADNPETVKYRDLKPANIIIGRAGDARIMDFGIARSMAVKSSTGPGVALGRALMEGRLPVHKEPVRRGVSLPYFSGGSA